MGVGVVIQIKDGFIHLSTADQLPGTLERFFSTNSGCGNTLYIYPFNRSNVDRQRHTAIKLQFDPAAGTLFGHIYGVSVPAHLAPNFSFLAFAL